MAIVNPLHIAASVLFFILAIPLTLFALFTTTLALSTLLLRVSIVYVELGAALLHSWLFVDAASPSETLHHGPHPASPTTQSRSLPSRRTSLSRPSSSHDASTITTALSIPTSTTSSPTTTNRSQPPLRPKSGSSASLALTSLDPTRDYEGVGGWRIAGSGDEEALWMGMNSRLELPAVYGERQRRHHRRMSSGGSTSMGAGIAAGAAAGVRISPIQSRARTPSATAGDGVVGGGLGMGMGMESPEGYFSFKGARDGRRRTGSVSSHSSAGGTPGIGLKRAFIE